jgi:hypothetical protein
VHKRKQIRLAMLADLVAGDISEVRNTDLTYRIFSNRPTPAWESELPAIFIYTATKESGSETAILESRPSIYKRNLNIAIEILVEADETVDDALDAIAEKVEQILGDNQEKWPRDKKTYATGGSPATAAITNVGIPDLLSTEIGLVDDGRKIVGSCKINLDIPYNAGLGEAADPVDEVERIHTNFNSDTDLDRALAEEESGTAFVPVAPLLIAPINHAIDIAISGSAIDWSASVGAETYEVQVSLFSDFHTIFETAIVTETIRTIAATMAHSTTYYWRVRAQTPRANSALSTVFDFTTVAA